MAFIQTIKCSTCENYFQGVVNWGSFYEECPNCKTKREAEEKIKYFYGISGLSIEERIHKIEEWIYEHNKKNHYSGDIKYG